MQRIGITGQAGFIGTHLFNYLGLQDAVDRVIFEDEFFQDENKLRTFVKNCDVIVHLAAMNRHNDPSVLYKTNIQLVQKLIQAMEREAVSPYVLFSSSTQEERDNLYGRSKKEGRELFIQWAEKNGAKFIGLVIPNVFGPFGNPYYNSVIATFSHQLTNNEVPKIETDGTLKLIYVGELVAKIWELIKEKRSENVYYIQSTSEVKVSEILTLLSNYNIQYFKNNIIPQLPNRFELNLFNTYRSYINHSTHFPVLLNKHTDTRGSFVEIVRTTTGGQFSFSLTHPDITRGDHFHTRKIERFAVISGEAVIKLRRIGTGKILHFNLNGEQPAFIDMPIWFTHNITNVGSGELHTLFWTNEFFDPNDPDTFVEKV